VLGCVLWRDVPAGSDLDFALAGWVPGPDDRQIELYEWNNLEQQYVVREAAAAGTYRSRVSTRNMDTGTLHGPACFCRNTVSAACVNLVWMPCDLHSGCRRGWPPCQSAAGSSYPSGPAQGSAKAHYQLDCICYCHTSQQRAAQQLTDMRCCCLPVRCPDVCSWLTWQTPWSSRAWSRGRWVQLCCIQQVDAMMTT
jgi:hypothetical protein